MLTIQQLDSFIGELEDLTREADPMELVIEATALLRYNQAQRFLMQRRAAAAADAHFLDGVSLAKIAKACGRTTQTVRLWLIEYGPSHYLTISEEPDKTAHGAKRLVLRLVRVESDDQLMKRKLRDLRRAGRRIVPASRDLLDPEQPDGYAAGIDAQALWDQLGA
jgi:hypothetical protein